jgi:hypothetical protein
MVRGRKLSKKPRSKVHKPSCQRLIVVHASATDVPKAEREADTVDSLSCVFRHGTAAGPIHSGTDVGRRNLQRELIAKLCQRRQHPREDCLCFSVCTAGQCKGPLRLSAAISTSIVIVVDTRQNAKVSSACSRRELSGQLSYVKVAPRPAIRFLQILLQFNFASHRPYNCLIAIRGAFRLRATRASAVATSEEGSRTILPIKLVLLAPFELP